MTTAVHDEKRGSMQSILFLVLAVWKMEKAATFVLSKSRIRISEDVHDEKEVQRKLASFGFIGQICF